MRRWKEVGGGAGGRSVLAGPPAVRKVRLQVTEGPGQDFTCPRSPVTGSLSPSLLSLGSRELSPTFCFLTIFRLWVLPLTESMISSVVQGGWGYQGGSPGQLSLPLGPHGPCPSHRSGEFTGLFPALFPMYLNNKSKGYQSWGQGVAVETGKQCTAGAALFCHVLPPTQCHLP